MRAIALALFLVVSQVVYAQKAWDLALDKDGIKVYLPKDLSSGQAFRASCTVDATLDGAIQMIRNARNYPSWISNIIEAKTVKVLNDKSFIVWYKIDMPPGFDDRDIVLLNTIESSPDQTVILLKSVPGAYPESQTVKRIEKAHGYWLFRKKSNGKLFVEYQFYTDMGINFPQWIVQTFMVKSPYKTLKNMKQCLEK